MSDNTLKENTVASVHYTGTLPDSGEVFDSSEGRDPLTFLVGHRQMIPGFEEEMIGATVGERREFTLTPDRAYGERDEQAVLQIPRDNFAPLEQEGKLEVGMQLVAQMPHGPAPFLILELTEELVTGDFNHALAGKSLTFSVEVVELRDASEEEISHGHVHGPGGLDH
ncbi:MAG: peptidylprolyl isomerase [Euryarchaeota archaeon]|nr:peptidylprolyl isomerase [Euryarchaeota archaeon]|tara:strand:- start:27319 stop:27822 length:504 start_codon:yes stop_codon:yes gene_type:complete